MFVISKIAISAFRLYLTEELKYFNVTTESRSKETDSNSLDGFKNSLRRDIDATEHIFQCLDDDDLSKVLDLIFTCKGNVLTSGIGMISKLSINTHILMRHQFIGNCKCARISNYGQKQ